MAGAIQPSAGSGTLEIQTTTQDPWGPGTENSQALGWSCALFGYPGVGKTTFCATPRTLILDLEGKAGEVLGDRPDVQIWPRKDPKTNALPKITWDDVVRITDRLATRPHPFEVVTFDSVTAAQRMTLAKVMKSSPTPDTPSQQEWGKSNELLNAMIGRWCTLARETGVNVMFIAHAEEVPAETSGIIVIRMSLTPGVIKYMNQTVSAIGYLAKDVKTDRRQIVFKETPKVLAKYAQNQSGPQLALQMLDPSLQQILDHREQVRKALAAS